MKHHPAVWPSDEKRTYHLVCGLIHAFLSWWLEIPGGPASQKHQGMRENARMQETLGFLSEG